MRRENIKQNHVLSNNGELDIFSKTLNEIEDLLKTFDSSHDYIQDCTGRELKKVLLKLRIVKAETNRHIENITTLHTETDIKDPQRLS